ncbi:MAG TPA: Fic family protein [Sphingobium sp.]|uniref:Fic family protein n=1 Tax=Sphingobium sp. TaxID=1912891 RepID=UPI002ED37A18
MGLFIDPKSPAGQFVSERNRGRQYDFLHTSFVISQANVGLEIDHEFICSLNLYATQYISPQPGRYRRHYDVIVGDHKPSEWYYVQDQMDDFLKVLHEDWSSFDPVQASAYTLWAVNHIHPFADGNGRTARALSYFVLCKKIGQWLPGSVTVMELIRADNRPQYCQILQKMHDARQHPAFRTNLTEMTAFLNDLILRQIQSVPPPAVPPSGQ